MVSAYGTIRWWPTSPPPAVPELAAPGPKATGSDTLISGVSGPAADRRHSAHLGRLCRCPEEGDVMAPPSLLPLPPHMNGAGVRLLALRLLR